MEHKALTNLLQPTLSWASQLISFHVLPTVVISSSIVLLSSRPLCLFPGGARRSALWGCLLLFIFRTWSNYLRRLCLTSSTMLLMPVHLLSYLSVWDTLFPSKFLNQTQAAPLKFLVSFQSSCSFSRSLTRTEGLSGHWNCRFSVFVLVCRLVDFHTFRSLLKAWSARPILVEIFFSMLHYILTYVNSNKKENI